MIQKQSTIAGFSLFIIALLIAFLASHEISILFKFGLFGISLMFAICSALFFMRYFTFFSAKLKHENFKKIDALIEKEIERMKLMN